MTRAPFYLDFLNSLPNVCAHFVQRIHGIEVNVGREAACARLEPAHREAVEGMGFSWGDLYRAEQVHAAHIAMARKGLCAGVALGADGLMTADSGILLGIYVADCGALYLVDSVKGVIALLHSGKKGTEKNITGKAIRLMQEKYGSCPADIHVVLAPCIRSPAYRIDFAAQIREQAIGAGILEAHYMDSGICTSSDLGKYYSYHFEKGNTGRMLSLLGMR